MFDFAGVPVSKMGPEKDLVRVYSSSLYLIITTAICGVDLVFRTFVSNIVQGKSLGAISMDTNGLSTELSVKYLLRALPSNPMSTCASGMLVSFSKSS